MRARAAADPPRRPGSLDAGSGAWRDRLHEIIFEADTGAGKLFDVALLITILVSVLVVILESEEELDQSYHRIFVVIEWIVTIGFTIEYTLRLICVRRPLRYVFSFFGLVDLLAVLPTYVSLLIPGAQSMLVIRALRLLRVFRVFKLARFLSEASALRAALIASRAKIAVFIVTILILVVIMGSAMYLAEGERNDGFSSIPESMYWAIVTMTTVGYGDTTPETVIGKFIAAAMMICGYSLIIIPTGILTAELARGGRTIVSTAACPNCSRDGHEFDATHCRFCGSVL